MASTMMSTSSGFVELGEGEQSNLIETRLAPVVQNFNDLREVFARQLEQIVDE